MEPMQRDVHTHTLSSQETYDPNRLMDTLRERMHLKNDAALSRALEVTSQVISKMIYLTCDVRSLMCEWGC